MPSSNSPALLTTHPLDGEALPGVAVVRDLVFVPLMVKDERGRVFGRVVAVDATRSLEIWRRDFPAELLNPPLLLADNTLFCSTKTADPLGLNAALYALDAKTGALRWQWRANMRTLSAPALREGTVWMVGRGLSLWGVDADAGAVVDTFDLDGSQHVVPPTVHGDLLLIPTLDAEIVAADVVQRREVWRYRHSTNAWPGPPLGLSDCAVVSFADGSLVALDARTGAKIWSRPPIGHRHLPALACDGQRLYVGDYRGALALSASDGETLWRVPSARRIKARPLLYANTLIIAGYDHLVRGLDPASGEVLWTWRGERRFEVDPAAIDAGLVVIDAGDTLILLDIPRRELSAQEALDAGDWRLAADLLAKEGRIADAARLLEEHDDLLEAARLWLRLGDVAKAATLFEQDDSIEGWEAATELYEEQGDWEKRAFALHQLAELKDDAASWERAQAAYKEAGMNREAAAAWREVCRLRKYPFIHIEARPEAGFVKDQYNILRLVVRNDGWGVAASLSARASGEGFAGEDMETQSLGNLGPGRTRELRLGLLPLRAGKVPLTLEISFRLGRDGASHTIKQRLFVDVATSEAQRQSSDDLARQINEGFDVTPREDFRRSPREIYEQQLQILKRQLAKRELQRTQYGIAAPMWLENEIDMLKEKIRDVERKLDDMEEDHA